MGSPRGAERIAEYPRPSHTLLHITDTHLVGGDELLYGTVDADARVRQILADIRASQVQPDALVFTGDLADRGQPDAYSKLRGLVEPVAQALGAQIVWAMGNHDDRATFRELLLDQAPSTGRSTAYTTSTACASSPSTPRCPASTTARSRRNS